MRWIVTENESLQSSEVGRKAAALAQLSRADFPVPAWFVVRPDAFWQSLPAAARTAVAGSPTSAYAVRSVSNIVPAESVRLEIGQALESICPHGELVSVRSSAIGETGPADGAPDTFLYVRPDEVAERVAAIWQTEFSGQLAVFRATTGPAEPITAPAVLVMRMVTPDASGKAYSADPVSGRRGVAVVAAVRGVGSSIAKADREVDTYHVDRQGKVVSVPTAVASNVIVSDSDKTSDVERTSVTSDATETAAVSADEARAAADLARRASRHFVRPQEIEWAIQDGRLFLLASSSIAGIESLPDPDVPLMVWDAGIMADMLSGATTPLTFSFVKRVLALSSGAFLSRLGVGNREISDNQRVLSNLLGSIDGRIYCNIVSLHRLLALLPESQPNRDLSGRMAGAGAPLPPEAVSPAKARGAMVQREAPMGNPVLALKFFLTCYPNLNARRFSRRLRGSLAPTTAPMEEMRVDELIDSYRSLEKSVLTHWDDALYGEFLTIALVEKLRRMVAAWCDDAAGTLLTDLLTNIGGIGPVEQARKIVEMADAASTIEPLTDLLTSADSMTISHRLRDFVQFDRMFHDYVSVYGDRCIDELTIEAQSVADDSLLLLRSIGRLAQKRRQNPGRNDDQAGDRARGAEANVRRSLAGKPLRQWTFTRTLGMTRDALRSRELLRLEEARVVGRVRRIFREIGRRLVADDRILDSDDVYFLTMDEIFGAVASAGIDDIKSIIELRRAQCQEYARRSPVSTLWTRGLSRIAHRNENITPLTRTEGDEFVGKPSSPGLVCAKVRVIRDPRNTDVRPGEILVAERTDPGWTGFIAMASGLIIEHGDDLSHGAILGRELGIPVVYRVPDATRWLRTGDLVELDGAGGAVRLCELKCEDEPAKPTPPQAAG